MTANCNMEQCLAELVGTFTLVLIGCGTAAVAGPKAGYVGIALAFGLALIGMAYSIGPVSGCHINPAVSLGAWIAGRLSLKDFISYSIAQCLGAILGALVLLAILQGQLAPFDVQQSGLGQNGWGSGYLGEFGLTSAFVFEAAATFLFVFVILGSTHKSAPASIAGLCIGLTLVAIHLFGIHITGVSVNPARSLGPALIVGGKALEQLWLFILAPMLGAGIAGMLYRFNCCHPAMTEESQPE